MDAGDATGHGPRQFSFRGGGARRGRQGGAHGGRAHAPVEMLPAGVGDARKSAIVGRFRPDLPLRRAHLGLMESIGESAGTLEALAAIWQPEMAVLPAPVCTRGFDAEETAVLLSGQITGAGQHGEHGKTHAGEGGGGSGAQPRAQPKPARRESSDDDEVLWATPGEEAAIGAFDAHGAFVVPGMPAPRMPPLERGSRPPAPDAEVNAVPEKEGASKPNPEAAPLVSPDTQWVYLDAAGAAQGPFPCAKMHAWHARGFFVDALLVRREADRVYAPLAEWRRRVGVEPGASPFAPAEAPPGLPLRPAAHAPSGSRVGDAEATGVGASDLIGHSAERAHAPRKEHSGAGAGADRAPAAIGIDRPAAGSGSEKQSAAPVPAIGRPAADARAPGAVSFGAVRSRPEEAGASAPMSDEQRAFLAGLGVRPAAGCAPVPAPAPMDDEQRAFLASLQACARPSGAAAAWSAGPGVWGAGASAAGQPSACAPAAPGVATRALDADQLSFLRAVGLSTAPGSSPVDARMADLSVAPAGDSLPFMADLPARFPHGGAPKAAEAVAKTDAVAKPVEVAKADASIAQEKRTEALAQPSTAGTRGTAVPAEGARPASPTVSWARSPRASASAPPLADILAEEDARAAEQARTRAAAAAAAAVPPRSFADTLRQAEAARRVAAASAAPAAASAAPAQSEWTSVAGGRPQPSVSAAPKTQPALVQKAAPSQSPPAPQMDARAFAVEQLSALDGLYDTGMCALVLMEMRSPGDVQAFVEDNIAGPAAAARGFDAGAFVREFVRRRFSAQPGGSSAGPSSAGAPATGAASSANPAAKPARQEAFQTVGKRAKGGRK